MRVRRRGNEAVLVAWTNFVHLGLLFDFVFKSWLCASRALGRHCVTAIFALFSYLLLHVCYVCTAVSQQAKSDLKVFPSFFVRPFFLLHLNCFIALDIDALDRYFLSEWHIPLHNLKQIHQIHLNHKIITKNQTIITLKVFIHLGHLLGSKRLPTAGIARSLFASFSTKFAHCDGAIFAHSSSQNCSGRVRSVRER